MASSRSYLVRALYDFEAAEDNELTFKAGEMIVVTDDSNENWWKGSNDRGDGLFPANFVTAELEDVTNGSKSDGKKVQFDEEPKVQIIEKDPEPVTIDEEKIDKLIHLLHEADPTGEEIDSDDLIALEEQCAMMGPLIDQELEKVDKKISQLNLVNGQLVEAMNMYRALMPQDNYNMYNNYNQPPGPGPIQGHPGGQPQQYDYSPHHHQQQQPHHHQMSPGHPQMPPQQHQPQQYQMPPPGQQYQQQPPPQQQPQQQ